jgi:ribosomal protein L28
MIIQIELSWHKQKKSKFEPGMMALACHPRTWEPGLHSETLSQKQNNNKIKVNLDFMILKYISENINHMYYLLSYIKGIS